MADGRAGGAARRRHSLYVSRSARNISVLIRYREYVLLRKHKLDLLSKKTRQRWPRQMFMTHSPYLRPQNIEFRAWIFSQVSTRIQRCYELWLIGAVRLISAKFGFLRLYSTRLCQARLISTIIGSFPKSGEDCRLRKADPRSPALKWRSYSSPIRSNLSKKSDDCFRFISR